MAALLATCWNEAKDQGADTAQKRGRTTFGPSPQTSKTRTTKKATILLGKATSVQIIPLPKCLAFNPSPLGSSFAGMLMLIRDATTSKADDDGEDVEDVEDEEALGICSRKKELEKC